eukprot:TRINITY_DN3577_c0_g1_i3.p1 TRINITY_DN3577_c0_g1~~TRINITY_DN3577_c0_g1_i3.p1  ORF type:complete len:139 (-),score=27.93 TRINITY_DN3577_c0_g1_i3:10-426(-)
MTRELGIPSRTIVLYGRSLGSGSVCEAARLHGAEVAGLVLHAPIASAIRVVKPNIYFTLPLDIFPNIDKAASIVCPTFIMHGTADEVVPFSHGETLSTRFPNLYQFWPVPNMHHNDLESHPEFLRRLAAFVQFLTERL